ncbi:MAG: MATE family efflux transporter, partial [Pygmaiobacter sp.]
MLGYLPFLKGLLILRLLPARLPLRQVGSLFANGASAFFSNISSSVLMVVLNTVLLRLAGPLGVADSMQPAISYNFGAGNSARLRALEGRLLLAGALLSISVLVLMQTSAQRIIPLFVEGSNTALIEMSIRAMQLFSLSYLVGWFGVITSSFFTALNRPLLAFATAFGKTLLFPIFFL